MKTKNTNTMTKNNNDIADVVLVTAVILAVPFLTMQLGVGEFAWDETDFLIVGALLLITGFSLVAVGRTVKDSTQRAMIGLALLGAAALVWIELAVGIFGTPFAGS